MHARIVASGLVSIAAAILVGCGFDFDRYRHNDGSLDSDATMRDAIATDVPGDVDGCVDPSCSACISGTHRCAGHCVLDTSTEACGLACMRCSAPPSGTATCDHGTCGFTCAIGSHACAGACVANDSIEACGTSCSPCTAPANATPTCDGTACGFACNAGRHNCGGACVLDTAIATCGTACSPCPTPPNATATCDGVNCGITCASGFHDCAGSCMPDTSPMGCGTACAPCPAPANAMATCDGTTCGWSCNAGYHMCGATCASSTSTATCGTSCAACPARANASPTCDGIACGFACNSGFADCNGDPTDGCETDLSTATDCGACHRSCTGALPVCSASGGSFACASGCVTGLTRCSTSCVDINTDPNHCGSCTSMCPAVSNGTATCVSGGCGVSCNSGYHLCGASCVPVDSTAACGASCTPCSAPANGTASCDGTSCGFTCNAGYHLCSGACLANTSPASCGAMCTACPSPANGMATCDGANCGIACDPGYTLVGASCLASCTACDTGSTAVSSSNYNRFSGTTSGVDRYAGSCGGAGNPEAVYKLTLTTTSDVFVATHDASWDTVLYVRSGCCDGAEIACNDDVDASGYSALTLRALAPGVYYIFVDGAGAGDSGTFGVDIFGRAATTNDADTCGNPTRIVSGTINGTTCGFADSYSPRSACLAGGASATNDLVYWFRLDVPAMVTFDTCSGATCGDTILYIRSVCNSSTSEVACIDDGCHNPTCAGTATTQSTLGPTSLAAGLYYLVLDSRGTCGPFTLTATGIP